MNRRAGTLVLAVFLLVLALAGFGNAYAMFFVPGFGTPLLSALALIYGITALTASIGLWRRSTWAFSAFLAWIAVLSLSVIAMQYSVLRAPWGSWFAFVAVAGAVLYLLARYVRKATTAAL